MNLRETLIEHQNYVEIYVGPKYIRFLRNIIVFNSKTHQMWHYLAREKEVRIAAHDLSIHVYKTENYDAEP
jgi:hypothetical protein